MLAEVTWLRIYQPPPRKVQKMFIIWPTVSGFGSRIALVQHLAIFVPDPFVRVRWRDIFGDFSPTSNKGFLTTSDQSGMGEENISFLFLPSISALKLPPGNQAMSKRGASIRDFF